ncbi:DUF6414 family protein [Microbacterium sp. NPDC055665]
MSGYRRPKVQLHKEFLYLNHETIINSLSAFEAGKVDEILEKVSEAREGGLGGTVGYGPVKANASKKKASNVEEELTRSRTNFSAFEAWSHHLTEASAFGELDAWDVGTRNEIAVGDTIRFKAVVSLSPVQQLFLTFIDYANQAADQNSIFKQPAAQLAETKKQARMMAGWMRGRGEGKSIMVSIQPLGVPAPRVSARLDEDYIVSGTQSVEGEFTVIAQVESLINEGEAIPAIRVLRETPPTSKETDVITEALAGFIEPAAALGVELTMDDITLRYPGVVLHPIAIYR